MLIGDAEDKQDSPTARGAGGVLSRIKGPNKFLPTSGLNKDNSEKRVGAKTPERSAYEPRSHTMESQLGTRTSHPTSADDRETGRNQHSE